MNSDGVDKIKVKLQELSSLIKEETGEESQEVRNEIVKTLNELKENLEDSSASEKRSDRTFFSDAKDDLSLIVDKTHIKDFVHDAKEDAGAVIDNVYIDDFAEDAKDDVELIIKDLEAKALKTQYTIQEKFSDSKNKKNQVVVNAADSLVKAIDKVKCALADCEDRKE